MNLRHLRISARGLLVGLEGLVVFFLRRELQAERLLNARGIGIEPDDLTVRPIGKLCPCAPKSVRIFRLLRSKANEVL